MRRGNAARPSLVLRSPRRRDTRRVTPEDTLEALLELLAKGDVDGFNDARPKRGRLDLFAADLSGVSAHGVDLSTANLEKADLTGADLTDAVLARANLSGADITEANLSGVMGLQSKWREAFFEDTDLTDADLSGADLADAEFTRVNLSRLVLTSGKLKRAIFRECVLTEIDVSEGKLAEVDMQGCDVSNSRMVEARLNEAKLANANLTNCDLTRARLGGADLSGANLTGAKLAEADLSRAVLAGATLTGADLSRADLTAVDLSEVDLTGATLTDAQLAVTHLHLAVGEAPPMTIRLIEEPLLAATGKRAGVLWENPERPPARGWLRFLTGALDKDPPEDAPALPVPADLVIARALAGTPSGFLALILLERPGGTAAVLLPLSKDGTLGTPRRLELGYTPAARPVLRFEEGALHLYGIAREGPGIVVHRVDDEGLTTLHGKAMRTVRGFVSDHHPIVLSKGGTLVHVTNKAVSPPMSVPADFPGRRYGGAPLDGGVALVWAPRDKKGLRIAHVGPGLQDEEEHLFKKVPIGLVDAATVAGEAWAVFTKEPVQPGDSSTAWAVRLPDGTPYAITTSETHDVSELRMVTGGARPYAVVVDLDGSLELFELKATKATSRWRIG